MTPERGAGEAGAGTGAGTGGETGGETGDTGARVSFLVAGAQKAGTSALFEYLRDVPGLQLPAVKEAHFFDDETVDWAAPDYAPYHRLFVADGRPWGEATPIYLYWPDALERIARYNPAMRLILTLRDPVERAWSHWRMEFARGAETEPFAWCIREGRARMAAAADGARPGFHRVFSYVERGFHGRQLAHLLGLFPAGQILLLDARSLHADPDAAIGRVCRFLGVAPPAGPIAPRIVRAARVMDYPSTLTPADVTFLQQTYASDRRRLAALVAAAGLAEPPGTAVTGPDPAP